MGSAPFTPVPLLGSLTQSWFSSQQDSTLPSGTPRCVLAWPGRAAGGSGQPGDTVFSLQGQMVATPECFAHLTRLLQALAGGRVCAVLEVTAWSNRRRGFGALQGLGCPAQCVLQPHSAPHPQGGYHLESLAQSVCMTLQMLLGDPVPPLSGVMEPRCRCKGVREGRGTGGRRGLTALLCPQRLGVHPEGAGCTGPLLDQHADPSSVWCCQVGAQLFGLRLSPRHSAQFLGAKLLPSAAGGPRIQGGHSPGSRVYPERPSGPAPPSPSTARSRGCCPGHVRCCPGPATWCSLSGELSHTGGDSGLGQVGRAGHRESWCPHEQPCDILWSPLQAPRGPGT